MSLKPRKKGFRDKNQIKTSSANLERIQRAIQEASVSIGGRKPACITRKELSEKTNVKSPRILRKYLKALGPAIVEENGRVCWKTTHARYAVFAKMMDEFNARLGAYIDSLEILSNSILVFIPYNVGRDTYYDFSVVPPEQDVIDAFAKNILDIRQQNARTYAELSEIAKKAGMNPQEYIEKVKKEKRERARAILGLGAPRQEG